MSTLHLRERLVAIARKDVGKMETSRNHGPAIEKFWTATSYLDGYHDRQPYCAAAVCYWVREWLRDPEVAMAFKKLPSVIEDWRCKSAKAFSWIDWAHSKGVLVMGDSMTHTLHTGDIMVFDMSHIGIVFDDYGTRVKTIEANTGATGGRDGDGIFERDRPREVPRSFIRLLA